MRRRDVAHAQGATVNDLLLAAVTGGLRALLLARGAPVEGLILYASVPVALRAQADSAALGDQVGLMVVPLPVASPTRSSGYSTSCRSAQHRGPERPRRPPDLDVFADGLRRSLEEWGAATSPLTG